MGCGIGNHFVAVISFGMIILAVSFNLLSPVEAVEYIDIGGKYGKIPINEDGFELLCSYEYSVQTIYNSQPVGQKSRTLLNDYNTLKEVRQELGAQLGKKNCPKHVIDQVKSNKRSSTPSARQNRQQSVPASSVTSRYSAYKDIPHSVRWAKPKVREYTIGKKYSGKNDDQSEDSADSLEYTLKNLEAQYARRGGTPVSSSRPSTSSTSTRTSSDLASLASGSVKSFTSSIPSSVRSSLKSSTSSLSSSMTPPMLIPRKKSLTPKTVKNVASKLVQKQPLTKRQLIRRKELERVMSMFDNVTQPKVVEMLRIMDKFESSPNDMVEALVSVNRKLNHARKAEEHLKWSSPTTSDFN